jgi:hypothetical protein
MREAQKKSRCNTRTSLNFIETVAELPDEEFETL